MTTTKFEHQRKRISAPCRASVNDDDDDDKREESAPPQSPDGVTPSDRERFARDARREGDAYVQDKLERELRVRGKIYRAEQELDEAKDGIVELGNESKTNIDAEGMMRNGVTYLVYFDSCLVCCELAACYFELDMKLAE